MSSATNVQHADPSSAAALEQYPTPARQGQRPIAKGVDSTDALSKGAQAVRTLLQKGVEDSNPRLAGSKVTPEPVRAARAILAGKLPIMGGLELDIDPMRLDASWPWFMFTPEREIASITNEPERRTALRLKFCEDLEDEQDIHARELTPRGVERVRELLSGAIEEAVTALAVLANDMQPVHRNFRLSARFCQAAREELAELLREWDEVADQGGSLPSTPLAAGGGSRG